MGKVTRFGGIDIIVRTRDEHCEPHVHVLHEGDGWELRIYFSFATSQIEELELYHGTAPKEKIVQACMDKVIDNLDKARELFWDAVQNVCLDNKFIAINSGVIQVADSKSPGAVQIKTARYVAKTKSIEYTVQGDSIVYTGKCP